MMRKIQLFLQATTSLNYDDIGHLIFLRKVAIPFIKSLLNVKKSNLRLITYGVSGIWTF